MNKEEYDKQLSEIAKVTQKKLQELQNQLNKEEIIEFRNSFDFFWLFMIKSAVGKEMTLHYLIELLNQYSKYIWNNENMNEKSAQRFKEIKEDLKNE